MDTSHRVEISTKGNVAGSASYVNAVKGVLGGKGNDKRMEDGSVQEERKLCLKAEGNGWLYRSAVAKLHRLISIDELKVQMAGMGVDNVLVRAMGGRSVILTCNNNEELENLLKVNCLQRWFSEIKAWEGQATCIERFVWLCCYGIPLNGWSNTSFKAIGELGHCGPVSVIPYSPVDESATIEGLIKGEEVVFQKKSEAGSIYFE
ncbi:hypothetical protein RHSIM_Rhsim12G0049400 [Rhododendron simsii]|uniref:DUF4283 domain-containing protein n=1 Tax=Rhododendron simsii TaxID=118357 RepID=A0A834G2N8_RHOSS|nr:hypothetical protein RHSIM_Rhsim12G0049400 [Rhododendron simsii]